MSIDWNQHFIQVGDKGANSFVAAIEQSTTLLKNLFENTQAPYSALEPSQLALQIKQANLGQSPMPLTAVIDEVNELIAKHSIIVQHPHCAAHLHTPPLVASIAAEAFIAALNQSMDSWDQASAGTFIEQEVTDWLTHRFGYGQQSDGVFTSGGTQSNLMGLLLARDNFAEKYSGHNVQKNGLPEYASKLRIVCSKNAHFTMQKSASLLGLGEHAVVTVPTTTDAVMDIDAAKQTIADLKAQGLLPFIITATAGTTDHGAIDNLNEVASLAKQHDMWMHVDAAYGGALMLSEYHSRLAGIEQADSITVDFHKMFFQTISCGALLLKNKNHFSYVCHHAAYLNREDDIVPNLVDKSIQTTRRFDALKVWMTLQNLGSDTLGKMVTHLVELTEQVAAVVKARPEFELLATPSLTTVLFRAVTTGDVDSLNKQIRNNALISGQAVVGETVINGQVALKFTLLNPCLSVSDYEQLLDKLAQLVK